MRKPRKFRPTVAETQLEERVVLSVAAAVSSVPVATSAQVTATLNLIHSALLTYQSTVSNALIFAQAQINAGRVTHAQAITLLEGYIGNKTSQLFFTVRRAAGILPYGAGFNAYILAPTSPVGDLPSGAQSLYALLTFPSQTTTGPIGALQSNVFTPLGTGTGDIPGALSAVSAAAIRSAYAQVKTIVNAYVINGIKAHDFTFHK